MASDPTVAMLATLEPTFALYAAYLVTAVRNAGIPLIITSARRSEEEQAHLVEIGASRTMFSKHLTGEAFDVDVMGYNRDDIPTWFWWELGPWAEQNLRLVWGGRWSGFPDYGHFESPAAPGHTGILHRASS